MPANKEQTDEHPIIFSGWSIRRILATEKTQTRRIVKPQPPSDVRSVMWDDMGGDWIGTVGSRNDPIRWNEKCPYGRPGDVLWVREAFRLPAHSDDNETPSEYANRGGNLVCWEATGESSFGEPGCGWGRKRPSIHMPRELCRLRLRVEGVRVERLHEINYEDVVAEGLESHVSKKRYGQKRSVKYPWTLMEDVEPDTGRSVQSYDYAFRKLWNHIHGTDAWEENPFVWIVEFSTIDTE
jgi:hypothetical protein